MTQPSAIRLERIKRGLTLEDISLRSGIDMAALSRFERGKCKNSEKYRDRIIDAICGEDAVR